jgi:hypothetical protein
MTELDTFIVDFGTEGCWAEWLVLVADASGAAATRGLNSFWQDRRHTAVSMDPLTEFRTLTLLDRIPRSVRKRFPMSLTGRKQSVCFRKE